MKFVSFEALVLLQSLKLSVQRQNQWKRIIFKVDMRNTDKKNTEAESNKIKKKLKR